MRQEQTFGRAASVRRIMARAFALCVLPIINLPAQMAPQGDTLADGAARALSAKEWSRAADAYSRLTARAPRDSSAWFFLGVAQQGAGKLDAAGAAYQQAIATGLGGLPPRLRLARVRALQGNASGALEALTEIAKSSLGPQLAPQYLLQQPDYDRIRSDPGFAKFQQTLVDARWPCRSRPEAHQLDFWIGSWSVSTSTGATNASSEITPAVEHCAVIEQWTDQYGGTGTSMNFFDPEQHLWRQIYVADGGNVLEYAGTYHDHAMWYDSVRPPGNGGKTRLVFRHLSADSVRQVFESSTDGGKRWLSTWEGLYVRRPAK